VAILLAIVVLKLKVPLSKREDVCYTAYLGFNDSQRHGQLILHC